MWQKLEDQEKDFEGFIGKMTEKIRKGEKTSAGTWMGSAHNALGSFLQCPLRSLMGETSRSRELPLICEHILLHWERTMWGVVVGPACQSGIFLGDSPPCPWCVDTGEFRHFHLLFQDSMVTKKLEDGERWRVTALRSDYCFLPSLTSSWNRRACQEGGSWEGKWASRAKG